MSRSLLISVVVPTYNRAAVLSEAIDSIFAQDVEPLEIIVVDDGSTDSTEEVARSYDDRVRYILQPHRGVAAARNAGLAAARGDLFAFLDSDDVWTEGSLAARLEVLATNPSALIVYGAARYRITAKDRGRFANFDENATLSFPMVCAMLCRREAFEIVGPFDESFEHSEDVEWIARSKENEVSMLPIDMVVFEYRIHGGNMTLDVKTNQAFLMRALRSSLKRRRR